MEFRSCLEERVSRSFAGLKKRIRMAFWFLGWTFSQLPNSANPVRSQAGCHLLLEASLSWRAFGMDMDHASWEFDETLKADERAHSCLFLQSVNNKAGPPLSSPPSLSP